VRKDDDLPVTRLADKALGDLSAVLVIERGYRIIEDDSRVAARCGELGQEAGKEPPP
jgi:hypothetical protein